MTIMQVARAIEVHRKYKDPFGWEFTLLCLVHDMAKLPEFDVRCLLSKLKNEYLGHIEAGDRLLIEVLEVIEGHLALRTINPA